MLVIKRDGRKVNFNGELIRRAMLKAYKEAFKTEKSSLGSYMYLIHNVICEIIDWSKKQSEVEVETIQDYIERALMNSDFKEVARAYITYRHDRTKARESMIDKEVLALTGGESEYWKSENSNKDSTLATTTRDYIAGIVSTDITMRKLLPPDVVEAHNKGMIHFHDADYFIQPIHNCGLVNLDDMLQHGTVISKVKIEKPHKFSTACNIASQIIAQVASNQYGGQSISLAHLSPFVEVTRAYFKHKYPLANDEQIQQMLMEDIKAGIQTLQYQIVTLSTTNGQTPFVTIYINLAETDEGQATDDLAMVAMELFNQRIQGVKNETGVYVSPAFPKLVYALDKDNIYPVSKYHYVTVKAAECSAKRLVPDFISNSVQQSLKEGKMLTPMGCRSFLAPTKIDENIAHAGNFEKYRGNQFYGRFNQGVVTINLPYVALEALEKGIPFYDRLREIAEICHKGLLAKHKALKGTKSDVAPILWQHGAYARLQKGETIDRLLEADYSSISLGYAGLYECVKALGYDTNSSGEGKSVALDILRFLNTRCELWKQEDNLGYSVYGTPIESTTYKFATALKRDFGSIDGVNTYNYITNSYHVNVREPIDAFSKLYIESEFQRYSLGGAVSYVETANLQNNIEAVLEIMKFIYHNIMYAEINTKSDYCLECGYDGEILIKGEHGNLYWECPNCKNTNEQTLSVVRRTCGYLGANFFNQGRTEEIKDRVLHLD